MLLRSGMPMLAALRGTCDLLGVELKPRVVLAMADIEQGQAGCLDRCEEGPCIVVYPEAVWYTYVDRDDIDEIIESHLKQGRIVERLRM
jgi:(2Fe-2S) ferredoxin